MKNAYPFNKDLNSKIYLLNTDILKINSNIDVLILQTFKNFAKQNVYRKKILKECGSKILVDLSVRSQESLSLSECFITSSYSLSTFKQIIHVVLPKFTITYQNACESSLHLAIRNVFDICIQNNIRSICFGSEIIKPSKSFPIMSAISVVCRTVHKCLEKFYNKFDKIFFVIEDKENFDKFRDTFKMYFPRNQQEQNFYSKYLPNILETEYGDIINPERQIKVKSDFEKNPKYSEKNYYNTSNLVTNNIEGYYMKEEDDIKNYKIYRNDKQRIKDAVLNSNDFSKQFYFEKSKLLTDDLNNYFIKFNFINFKGIDILQRQMFYIYLNKIDFFGIDSDHLIDPLIIFITRYLNQFIKSYDRILFIVITEGIEKKNYPTIYFIKTIINIISSDYVKSITNIDSHQILLHMPSLIFKIYFYFLRIYINKDIWNLIQFSDNSIDNYDKS